MDSKKSPSKRADGRSRMRKENELWIPAHACINHFVEDGIDLLELEGYDEIVIKAKGRAIKIALEIVELIHERSIYDLDESRDMDSTCSVPNITITLTMVSSDESEMDSYESRSDSEDGRSRFRKENELWIPNQAFVRDYVRDGIDLLEVDGYEQIVVKARGRAVEKALRIVEFIRKRSIYDLHESRGSDSTCDVPNITITLSRVSDETQLDSGTERTTKEREIRIPNPACIINYVRCGIGLLEVKGYDEIWLKAFGEAVQNAYQVAESIKGSFSGLWEIVFNEPDSIVIVLSKKRLKETNLNFDEWVCRNRSSRTHGRTGTKQKNELRIPTGAIINGYLSEAVDLLQVKGYNEIILKAMGRAVKDSLKVAQAIKRTIAGLRERRHVNPTCTLSNITIALFKKGLDTTSRRHQRGGSGHGMGDGRENLCRYGDDDSREAEKIAGSVFCQENKALMKDMEKVEDCFILDFNPFEPTDPSRKLSQNDHNTAIDDEDLVVIAERGQVACRHYPHSRHHCVKFPFYKTPH